MTQVKYNLEINQETINNNLTRIINQVYKLLPSREEGLDWTKPLDTIIVELVGMGSLFVGQQELFFSAICKLKGLLSLAAEEDFLLYRRTIFEILSCLNELKLKLCQDQTI